MGRGPLVRALAIATIAGLAARGAADPDEPGAGSGSGSGSAQGEIQMDDGSGSGSGSATDAAPVKDPKVARRWLQAAQILVQKGDYLTRANRPIDAKGEYDNAVTAYQKAIDAGDDVAVYYSLALVEDKLGQDAAAYKHLQLVVDPKAGAKADIVKKAQAKLDDVSMKIGIVRLKITPDGATVSLGGKQIGQAPISDPLVFDPGTYTVSLAAVGYQPKEVELKVEAGSESDRKIALDPVPVVVKAADTDEPQQPAETPNPPSTIPIYVGAGATAALVVTATITGIAATVDHSTYIDPKTAPADRKDAQSHGRTLAHVTDACWLGAVAAGAFTAYWYLYRWAPQMRATGTDHWLLVGPWAAPDAGGAVVSGSF